MKCVRWREGRQQREWGSFDPSLGYLHGLVGDSSLDSPHGGGRHLERFVLS